MPQEFMEECLINVGVIREVKLFLPMDGIRAAFRPGYPRTKVNPAQWNGERPRTMAARCAWANA